MVVPNTSSCILQVLVCCTLLFGLHCLVVKIDTQTIHGTVDDKFLSFTLDGYLIQTNPRWLSFNFSSPRLKTLLKGLSPAVLRMGGTPADFSIFTGISNDYLGSLGYAHPLVSIHAQDFDNLVELTRETNLRFLYDLNLQLRYGKSWDPTNTIEILQYLSSKGYGDNVDFELGNEPSEYWNEDWFVVLNGTQIGRDFVTLRTLMDKFPGFKSSSLVGPDIAGVHKVMLSPFLDVAGKQINAMTFHHYYFKGTSEPDVTNFLNTTLFLNLRDDLIEAQKIISQSPVPNLPIWIGETSDCWNSGTPNVSDRYVSGFMWMEKLGLSAKMGVKLLLRQDFYGHNYGLINNATNPNPDYWLSLLHKQLVDRHVLNVTISQNSLPGYQQVEPLDIRVYAHCTRSGHVYKAGAITGFALNVKPSAETIYFEGPLGTGNMDVYLLTPPSQEGLLSSEVALNGKVLRMVDDYTFPDLLPRKQSAKLGLSLPKYTFAFFVFPDADVEVCK